MKKEKPMKITYQIPDQDINIFDSLELYVPLSEKNVLWQKFDGKIFNNLKILLQKPCLPT